ncbi:MAG: hypothetical protein Q8L36_00015 [bacterium]|nr:hypothetical protein [bacterium]
MAKNKILYIVLSTVIVVGFAWSLSVLQEIHQTLSSLVEEIQSFRTLVIALDSTEPAPTETPKLDNTERMATSTETDSGKTTDIPTSIIFSTLSSPLLLPQSALTITLEKASFSAINQTVTLHTKIFTSESDSFNAIEPTPLFSLFNKENGELKTPAALEGLFNQLPPRSAVPGKIVFPAEPNQDVFIFKIGENEKAKFYEFNFKERTYKETTVG